LIKKGIFRGVCSFSACSQRCGRSAKRKDSSRGKGREWDDKDEDVDEDEDGKDDSDAPSPCSCWSRLFIVHI